MIKVFKNIIVFSIILSAVSASAQSTINSPYSQFGLGEIKGALLPQNRAMGGISAGFRRPGGYYNINISNPASYSSVKLTTFDVGAYAGLRQLSNTNASQNNFNGTLSHITFAIPVNAKSALSFGLIPFSDYGFQYKKQDLIGTTNVDYVYSGEGGLSKAYLGYGVSVAKNLSIGFNVGYLFGNLKNSKSTEFPSDPLTLNSRTQSSKSISGLSYDYGLQYEANVNSKSKLVLGYSGNAGAKINLNNSVVTSRYRKNFNSGDEDPNAENIINTGGTNEDIKMPMGHLIGFVFERTNRWLIGADISYNKWSNFREGNVNPELNDSYGLNIGAQITPDITAVNSYLKVIDYRCGFKYDKTYITINDNDISQYGITLGLGLPLQPNRSTFYKINFSTELGQRGTLENSLVRERYVNFNLGFIMNDKWFNKSKID